MSQGRHDRGIDASRQGVDGESIAHGLPDVPYFIVDKFIYVHIFCLYFFHLDHGDSFEDRIIMQNSLNEIAPGFK